MPACPVLPLPKPLQPLTSCGTLIGVELLAQDGAARPHGPQRAADLAQQSSWPSRCACRRPRAARSAGSAGPRAPTLADADPWPRSCGPGRPGAARCGPVQLARVEGLREAGRLVQHGRRSSTLSRPVASTANGTSRRVRVSASRTRLVAGRWASHRAKLGRAAAQQLQGVAGRLSGADDLAAEAGQHAARPRAWTGRLPARARRSRREGREHDPISQALG